MGSQDKEESSRKAARRYSLLENIHHRIELPMVILGILWLLLLIIDLTKGLSPPLQTAFQIIWILFIADFILEFTVSPGKLTYLKRNWLTALSLAVPALRVFRVFRAAALLRAASAARGARLVGVLGSINRGMRSLGRSLGKRGFGYVVLLTVLVTFAGAAGMYSFEKDVTEDLSSYGSALWWTAMIITTMGSGDWPQTAEGRILCFLLAVYSFSIFGYITAALASFFVGQDKNENAPGPPEKTPDGEPNRQTAHAREQLKNVKNKGGEP